MTNKEYDLLCKVRDKSMKDYRILPPEDIAYLSSLKEQKLIFMDIRGNVSLEPKAYAALELFEQEAEQHAEAERQQRFDNKISIANVLVPFITFILGLFAERFCGIIAFFSGFFH